MKRLETTKHHNNELLVYRVQHDNGKIMDFWYYSVNIPNQKTIKDKSTKEREFASAFMFAETQYQKLKERAMMGISISAVSYQQVFKQACEYYQDRVKAGFLDKQRFNRFCVVNERCCISYFQEKLNRDFGEINSLDIENWIVWRKAKGQRQRGWHNRSELPEFHPDRPLSNGTINMELQMIRMVYDFAEKAELMLPAQRPRIKSLKHSVQQNRRPEFTWSEWNKLTNYLTKSYLNDLPPSMAKTNLSPIYKFYRRHNQYFWQLLFLTGCRVGELKTLRWGNLDKQTRKEPETKKKVERLIISVDGKTGRRRVACQPYAIKMFDDWKKICEEFMVSTNSDELVFKHPEFTNQGEEKAGQKIETTNVAFKGVLEKLGLSKDADGRQRTVYSIRHTAISNMLRRGISINAVSKNAGVSIDTLSRAYDHTQSDDYVAEITKNDYTRFDEKREKLKSYEN